MHRLHDFMWACFFINPIHALPTRMSCKRLKIIKQYPVLPYCNILQTLFFITF